MTLTVPDCFHRYILAHNTDEKEKVSESMEVWGREARTLSYGLCVQAYPDKAQSSNSYEFGTEVNPKLKYGFLNRAPVIREVAWYEGMDGVEYRDDGKAVCIPIVWVR